MNPRGASEVAAAEALRRCVGAGGGQTWRSSGAEVDAGASEGAGGRRFDSPAGQAAGRQAQQQRHILLKQPYPQPRGRQGSLMEALPQRKPAVTDERQAALAAAGRLGRKTALLLRGAGAVSHGPGGHEGRGMLDLAPSDTTRRKRILTDERSQQEAAAPEKRSRTQIVDEGQTSGALLASEASNTCAGRNRQDVDAVRMGTGSLRGAPVTPPPPTTRCAENATLNHANPFSALCIRQPNMANVSKSQTRRTDSHIGDTGILNNEDWDANRTPFHSCVRDGVHQRSIGNGQVAADASPEHFVQFPGFALAQSPGTVVETPLPSSSEGVVKATPFRTHGSGSANSGFGHSGIPATPSTGEAELLLQACEQGELQRIQQQAVKPSPMPVKNLHVSGLHATEPQPSAMNHWTTDAEREAAICTLQPAEHNISLKAANMMLPPESHPEAAQPTGIAEASNYGSLPTEIKSTRNADKIPTEAAYESSVDDSLPLHLSSYLPSECVEAFGLPDGTLYDWQAQCLHEDGVLSGKNLVYCAPTSGGKSLVAEVLMIRRLHFTRRPFLLVLPYVALCTEKHAHLERLLAPLEREVRPYYGKHGGTTQHLLGANVGAIVATIEKANMLVNRLLEENVISQLGAVVVDELHMVGEEGRGHTLELMLSKLAFYSKRSGCSQQSSIQIVGMSATMPNAGQVAKWLSASLFTTDYRPVLLSKFVRQGWSLLDEKRKEARRLPDPWPELDAARDMDEAKKAVLVLVNESISKRQNALVFLGTKFRTVMVAQLCAQYLEAPAQDVAPGADVYTREQAIEDLNGIPGEAAEILRKTIPKGFAFHNSDLIADLRKVVESAFKSGAVLALAATPTVSTGVNLPAWRVVIADPWIGIPTQWMTPAKCRQMCGRAGRKGLAASGEAVLFPHTSKDSLDDLYGLLHGECSPVASCLLERGIELAMLEVIANNTVSSGQDVLDYLHSSLFFVLSEDSLEKNREVKQRVKEGLEFLQKMRLISWDKATGEWSATTLGKAAALSSMAPERALLLHSDLETALESMNLQTDLHLTFLAVHGEEMRLSEKWHWQVFLNVVKSLPKDQKGMAELLPWQDGLSQRRMKLDHFLSKLDGTLFRGGSLVKKDIVQGNQRIAGKFLAAKILFDLIEEVPIQEIVDTYKVQDSPSRWKYLVSIAELDRLQESAGAVVAQVQTFCERLRSEGHGWGRLADLMARFQGRILSGVQADIVSLTDIPGVQAKRARKLFNAKLRTPEDVAQASVEQVAKALEGSSNSKHTNPALLRGVAAKIISAARKLVRQRAQELKEQADAALRAAQSRLQESHASHVQESQDIRSQSQPTDSLVNGNVASIEKHAQAAHAMLQLDVRGDTCEKRTPAAAAPVQPLHVQLDVEPVARSWENVKCAWSWRDGHEQTNVSLSEIEAAWKNSSGPVGIALDLNDRTLSTSQAVTAAVAMPQLKGSMVAVPNSDSSVSGWAVAFPTTNDMELFPRAVYYVPLSPAGQASSSPHCSWDLLESLLAFSAQNFSLVTDNSSPGVLATCDLKEQLSVLLRCPKKTRLQQLGDRLASLSGSPLVDVRIGAWMLHPDETSRVSDKLGGWKNNQLSLLKLHALEAHVQQLTSKLRGQGPRWEAARKAAFSLVIYQLQSPRLAAQRLEAALLRQEMPLVPILAHMEIEGISIDGAALQEQCSGLSKTLKEMEDLAHSHAGQKFSLTAPQQVRQILFQVLNIPVPPIALEGAGDKLAVAPSTRLEVLEQVIAMLMEKLAGETRPEAIRDIQRKLAVTKAILEHRRIGKLLGFFLAAIKHSKSGNRIHGQFLQTCTGTGRLAMDDPNLQCVPKPRTFRVLATQQSSQDLTQHRDSVANCRRGFVASAGNVLLGADYCQLELRIMAHLSDEPLLKQMFDDGADPFRKLAAQWLGGTAETVSIEQRAQAKELAYAMIYGAGNSKIAESLGCSESTASELRDSFQKAVPGHVKWISSVIEDCRKRGWVETIGGRRRYLPGINDRDRTKRARAERQAVNTVCQGSAADIAKLAMIRLTTALRAQSARTGRPAGRLLLQIHDELLLEVPEGGLYDAARCVAEAMEGAVRLRGVPLAVKLQSGPSWGELRPLDPPLAPAGT